MKRSLIFLFEILNEDYDLHLATCGEEAQVLLANELVHLVISDIMMPGIDGFQLCQQIKTIARMGGYSSQSIFAKNFLKQYKLTPTKYFKNSSPR